MSETAQGTPNAEAITGGPTDDLSPVAPAQQELPLEPKKPLYEGFSGAINSADELATYTKSLEAKLVEANLASKQNVGQTTIGGMNADRTQAIPKGTDSKDDPAFLIYHDPKRALDIHEQRILEKIEKQKQAEANERKFWDDTYLENPDLRSIDPIVKSIMTSKWNELAPLSIPEARKILVKESRKMVDLVRSQLGVKSTELSSQGGVNLGASGQPAPRIQQPSEPKPTTLAEELAALRRKRRA
jgi:hypothetical protein